MFHDHIQSTCLTYLQHTSKYWSCMNAFDNLFTMATELLGALTLYIMQ